MAKGDDRFKQYPAGAKAGPPIEKHHPIVNPTRPSDDVLDDENDPGLGRGDRLLAQNRAASGGLSDDPTESGEPVKNRRSFTNLQGGR